MKSSTGLYVLAVSFALALSPAAFAQSSQILTKQYDTGGVYTGMFKDGLQHGQGVYVLPNGYEYDGEYGYEGNYDKDNEK